MGLIISDGFQNLDQCCLINLHFVNARFIVYMILALRFARHCLGILHHIDLDAADTHWSKNMNDDMGVGVGWLRSPRTKIVPLATENGSKSTLDNGKCHQINHVEAILHKIGQIWPESCHLHRTKLWN